MVSRWLVVRRRWIEPPAGFRGPILDDPEHRQHMNQDGPGQVTVRLGNWKDPVLKPWAAAQMRESNEEVLSGKQGLPFLAQSQCYPGGVPGQLLFPGEPFYFIQTPKQVWMIWQRNHMVRRIYLTDKHSETVKPSWFGEFDRPLRERRYAGRRHDRAAAARQAQLHRRIPHPAHRKAACSGALQAVGRRPDPGSLRKGHRSRYIQ